MKSLEKLIEICNKYKKGEFNIEIFESKLETIYLPDEFKNTLEKEQYNAINKLEEIRFSYSESNQKQFADKVAENLISNTERFLN